MNTTKWREFFKNIFAKIYGWVATWPELHQNLWASDQWLFTILYDELVQELLNDDDTAHYLSLLWWDKDSEELKSVLSKIEWRDPKDDKGFSLCDKALQNQLKLKRRSYFKPYIQWWDDQTQLLFTCLMKQPNSLKMIGMCDYYNIIMWIHMAISWQNYNWEDIKQRWIDKYIESSSDMILAGHSKSSKKELSDEKEAIIRSNKEYWRHARWLANQISISLQEIVGNKKWKITPDQIDTIHIVWYNILVIFLYGEKVFKSTNILINPDTKKPEAVDMPYELGMGF